MLFAPSGAIAQQTVNDASISGKVTDASAGVVAGAVVTATHLQTNVTNTAVTDDRGSLPLRLTSHRPIRARRDSSGIARAAQPMTLTAGSAFVLPIVLGLEGLSTDVTVTAENTVLESARSQIAITVAEAELRQVPLNGRNLLDVALLAPSTMRWS